LRRGNRQKSKALSKHNSRKALVVGRSKGEGGRIVPLGDGFRQVEGLEASEMYWRTLTGWKGGENGGRVLAKRLKAN